MSTCACCQQAKCQLVMSKYQDVCMYDRLTVLQARSEVQPQADLVFKKYRYFIILLFKNKL